MTTQARQCALTFWANKPYYIHKYAVQSLAYPDICRLTVGNQPLAQRTYIEDGVLLVINVIDYKKPTLNLINELLELTRTTYRIQYSAVDSRAYLRWNGNEFVQSLPIGSSITMIQDTADNWRLYKY